MADFLEGVNAGSRIAEVGLDAYRRSREFQDKLTTRNKDMERRQEAENRQERHASKQDELIDEEIKAMKEGRPKSGAAPRGSSRDPMESVLSKSLSNARAAHSAALAAGAGQAELDASARKYAEAQKNWDNYQSRRARVAGMDLYTTPEAKPVAPAPEPPSFWDRLFKPAAPEESFHQYDK